MRIGTWVAAASFWEEWESTVPRVCASVSFRSNPWRIRRRGGPWSGEGVRVNNGDQNGFRQFSNSAFRRLTGNDRKKPRKGERVQERKQNHKPRTFFKKKWWRGVSESEGKHESWSTNMTLLWRWGGENKKRAWSWIYSICVCVLDPGARVASAHSAIWSSALHLNWKKMLSDSIQSALPTQPYTYQSVT